MNAMKLALAAKRGKFPVEKLRKAAKKIYESMTEAELVEYLNAER